MKKIIIFLLLISGCIIVTSQVSHYGISSNIDGALGVSLDLNKSTADQVTPGDDELYILNVSNLSFQTDSLTDNYSRTFRMNFEFGAGFFNELRINKDTVTDESVMRKGVVLGINFSFILSGKWGGSVSYNAGILKSNNIPMDWYNERVFTPKDYVNILSFNLLREFSTPKKTEIFGIEAGPSWVSYSSVEIKPNPDYVPGRLLSYKYYKSRSISSTLGVTIRAKMEFLLSPSSPTGGVGLAAFININNLKPSFGLELYFTIRS